MHFLRSYFFIELLKKYIPIRYNDYVAQNGRLDPSFVKDFLVVVEMVI